MFNWQNIVLLVLSYVVIPRLTFLPSSLHTLLIVFGPFLLPRVINLLNTSRAASRSVPVRPVPTKVQRALNLLLLSTIVCLALSLPRFAEENIFLRTQSRWQIEPNVLFTRLGLLRELTPEDEMLREKFTINSANKMLYFAFGPDTLLNCLWCNSAASSNPNRNYFFYALPKLLTPHITHLAVLGIATSSMIGPEGNRFRTHATIAGLALLVTETWYLGTYDPASNKRAKVLQEVDFAHWRVRVLRYLAFALVDAALTATLYLTSTNRWLARPEPIANRLESTTKTAEETLHKLRALGLLENSINRDPGLRLVREEYWRTEGQVMSEAVAEPEVTEKINAAIGNMDLTALEGKVGEVADGILSAIDGLRSSQVLASSGTSEGAMT
ncbi:uncharacterized protein N0V89_002331 [Didymosphaeria variabile]|uniref:Uncharacterized protein n=1 Tax=Didymosphaeria variabile TaxID=1932322 RepID=A0A9W9CEA6_9PLEO|nr:uncharacterized protein N0V89_002331 [Didymosphaeria variabile]KAJ4357755.1 hypothetical protein N0V89_002331 [Didymosphaeria variabile]